MLGKPLKEDACELRLVGGVGFARRRRQEVGRVRGCWQEEAQVRPEAHSLQEGKKA